MQKVNKNQLFNVFITELKLDWRSKLNILIFIISILVCFLEAFYILSADWIMGDSIALSSWVTQIYIVLGITYGILAIEKEKQEIKELICSYQAGDLKNIVKLSLLFIEACCIYLGCILCLETSLVIQSADAMIKCMVPVYILIYWILPFVIMGVVGMLLANLISGRGKYVVGVIFMIFSGPMVPNLVSPLMDTRMGLYKYLSFGNLGPMNTYKPINLLFGYSIPIEKNIMLLLLFIGAIIIFSFIGVHRNGIALLIKAIGLVFICIAYFINFKYIDDHYEVETALEMERIYDKKTECTAHNEYEIKSMNLILIEKSHTLEYQVELIIKPQKKSNCLTFMLYHDMVLAELFINGKETNFSRDKDLVVLNEEFEEGEIYSISAKYSGTPPFQMYYNKENWILPSYLAWYPMQGNGQNISYGADLMGIYFVSNSPESDIHFKVEYQGKSIPYCNLSNTSMSKWEGDAQGIILLNSNWVQQIELDGNTYIYPRLCTNYKANVRIYGNRLNEYLQLVQKDSKRKPDTYFFVCDTTYTGRGENIYSLDDHNIIEITRAYKDGSELNNPNIGIYAIIKNTYLRDSDNGDLNYIFETAYISACVDRGMLPKEVLVRNLDEIQKMYQDNGLMQQEELVKRIRIFLQESDIDQQENFFEKFSELLSNDIKSYDKIFELL